MLILEKNCHYEPLVLKLGRLKRKVQDMGELMDTLTRYVESDDTKDPGEDDDKGSTSRRASRRRAIPSFRVRATTIMVGKAKGDNMRVP